jgi:DNA polymerase III delta subunit
MIDQAQAMSLELSNEQARQIITRTGLDQWKMYQALEKLTLVDTIDSETIEATIDKTPSENVFTLLEMVLRAEEEELSKTLTSLKSNEDPYKVAGLLASQIMQLAVLAVSRESPAVLAKTLGVHPFMLSRLAPLAKTLGPVRVKRLVEVMAQTDSYMKTTSTDPWILVERVLSEARR